MPDTSNVQLPAVDSEHIRRIHGGKLACVMTGLMLTLLLPALDQTIVGTAMPKIVGSLQGFEDYAWVVTSYLLGATALLPVAGRLSDQFGRKGFLVGGTIVFLIGSAACGAAGTMGQLILFRGVQGFAAGIGIILVFTVIADIFPLEERVRWQGLFGAVYGFASVAGPTLGGWLADHGPLIEGLVSDATRWRWVFYINLPIGLVGLALVWGWMPHDLSERVTHEKGWAAVRRIDIVGALLSLAATVTVMLALTWVSQDAAGWKSPRVVTGLVASAVLFVVFFLHERRTKAEPVLPLDLLGERVYGSLAVLSFLTGLILLALVIYLPLYLQRVAGWTASGSGIAILPLTVTSTLGASISGYLMARLGHYRRLATAAAILMLACIALMTQFDATTPDWIAGTVMGGAGLGLGVFFPITMAVSQAVLPRSAFGIGTNAIGYVRAVGQMFGVAVVGTILHNTMASGRGLDVALQHGFLAVAIVAAMVVVVTRMTRDVSITGKAPGAGRKRTRQPAKT